MLFTFRPAVCLHFKQILSVYFIFRHICLHFNQLFVYIFSAASRSMLTRHLQENPIIERSQSSQVTNDIEREDLRNALISGLFFQKILQFHEIFKY